MNPDQLIGGIVTIVAAAIAGGAVAWINRGKTNAEAGTINVTGSMAVVDRTLALNQVLLKEREYLNERLGEVQGQFKAELSEMKLHIARLEEENEKLRERCRKLETENKKLKEDTELS